MFCRLCLLLGTSLAFSPLWAGAAERNASGATAFNPKISLILNSLYGHYSVDSTVPADVGGVLPGGESGFAPAGFSLGETEMVVESNIDDQFHGWATISMAPGGAISVEEAFVNTLALPAGLAVKLGRFKSEIGYQNHIHAHAWEFVDAPIVYRALLGTQLQDDGVQLRWVAPTDLLVEIGAEALRGDAYPAGGDPKGGFNNATGFIHLGGDAGDGGSWRVGLSHLRAKANGRVTGEGITTLFTGNSDVSGADLVFKWAPNGNPANTNFVFNAEYFYRKEAGALVYDPDSADPTNTGPIPSAYDGKQQGYYAQAIYQFMPRWRAGVRYDWLHSANNVGTPAPGTSLATLADNSYDPKRYSVMADFSNSEFSRVRLQYNRDESRPAKVKDNQFFVQFIYSLGAHPAHSF